MDAPGIMQRRNQHTPVQAQDSGSLSLTLNRKRGALPSRAGPFIPRTPAPSTLLVSPRLRGLPPPFTPPAASAFHFHARLLHARAHRDAWRGCSRRQQAPIAGRGGRE
jgi:hypothetical protein